MQPADAVRYQSMFQQMDNDRDGYVQASILWLTLPAVTSVIVSSTWQPRLTVYLQLLVQNCSCDLVWLQYA